MWRGPKGPLEGYQTSPWGKARAEASIRKCPPPRLNCRTDAWRGGMPPGLLPLSLPFCRSIYMLNMVGFSPFLAVPFSVPRKKFHQSGVMLLGGLQLRLFPLLFQCGKRCHQSGAMPMGGLFPRIAFFFDQSGVMPLDCSFFPLLVYFLPLGRLLQSGLMPLEMLIPE